jgi:polygalacturonase
MKRREFLAAAAVAIAARAADAPDEKAVLDRIRAPQFPARDFDITKYGARSGGKASATDSIRRAIDACAHSGGGRVVVPRGEFLTGAIHLKSNVALHVETGATLRFSQDPKDYLPAVFTRWEGTELWNYSPLIYALDQSNIAITGDGVLDGQADADHWWNWRNNQTKDREALHKLAEDGVAVKDRVFGEGHILRTQFLQPYRCQNVLIEGVTIRNSPMWEIHPVQCRNVTVRGVKIDTHGPNNDGCDPESCDGVLIENCVFDTGDDCIAIKSGRNADGRRLHAPCENLVIRNCTMKDGHGGVSIGSEISGDVRNVFVRNCQMSSPHLQRALRIKTNSYRGGVVENISFRDVTIGQVANDAVQIDFFYEEGEGGPFQPVVRNVRIANVTCGRATDALEMKGYASSPIRDVHVEHCTFDNTAQPDVFEHVEGLELIGVTVNGKPVTR